MNHLDEERLAELAMKTVARQITSAEQAELEALSEREPAAQHQFAQRLVEARVLAESTALLHATESRTGELPGYARERLQSKVRQTYGTRRVNPIGPISTLGWLWRLGLGGALGLAALTFLVTSLRPKPSKWVIHLAMLDPVGEQRGVETNRLTALVGSWPDVKLNTFKTSEELSAWRNSQAGAGGNDSVFVVYDLSAGELLVTGIKQGRPFEKRFEVGDNLALILEQARRLIAEQ